MEEQERLQERVVDGDPGRPQVVDESAGEEEHRAGDERREEIPPETLAQEVALRGGVQGSRRLIGLGPPALETLDHVPFSGLHAWCSTFRRGRRSAPPEEIHSVLRYVCPVRMGSARSGSSHRHEPSVDPDLDALAELQGRRLERAIFTSRTPVSSGFPDPGASTGARRRSRDLLDFRPPGLAVVSLGRDAHLVVQAHPARVELVELGLDARAREVRDRDDLLARLEGLRPGPAAR
jgi:hypothetical protein